MAEKEKSNIPLLAVVLLSYNSKPLLEKFLSNIIKTIPDEYQFVLVNNGSTDDTADFLKNNFSEVEVFHIEKNQGFTEGYNTALKEIKAKYYCLISSDVEVTENWVKPVMDLMLSDENIAICQPKIKSYHKKDEFEYAGAAGGYIDYLGYPFCRGRIFFDIEKDTGQYNDNKEIFWASGACFFIKADIFHTLDGFDKDYFAHMEEIDLCWRAKNMGYKVMACPKSEVYHVGGYVINYGSPKKTYLNFRNNLMLLTKNLPKEKVFSVIFMRMILDGVAFFQSILQGKFKNAGAIFKAHQHFYAGLSKWKEKRRIALKQVKNRNTVGIYPKNIVWQHFIKKRKVFSSLD